MARSRMIKPEFWDDEVLAQSTSRDARLAFIGMWNHSDDYGVVKGNAVWLKSKIFPYEDIKPDTFQKWLNELEKGRWILPFVVDGAKYYYIQAFTKHQTINRPSQQRNPSPPDSLIEDSLNAHDGLTPEVNRSKENIKEEKKKEDGDVFILPENIRPEIWDAFIVHRKAFKKPFTEHAKKLLIEKLEKIGQDKNEVLNQSILKGWQDVFPLKDENLLFQQQPSQPEDPIEKAKRGMGL